MARIPATQEEWQGLAQGRLEELWDDVCSPEIYRFALGVSVCMYPDHAPPHFHLCGPDCSAVIRLSNMTVTQGQAPPEALAEAIKWATANKELLRKEWERRDLGAFFDELERIIRAPLDMQSRIRVAQAMAAYCNSVWSALEAEDMAEAKRLVRGARREIKDLQKVLEKYERVLRTVAEGSRKKLSAQAGRESWAAYQSAKQCCEQLRSLAGYSAGLPNMRLADAVNDTSEALWKIASPFRNADCETALSILDKLLDRWGTATGLKRGQAWRSKALTELITRLGKAFEGATGRPPKARTGFTPFVKRTLASLPPGMVHKTSDFALPKRLKRIRRSQSKTPPKNRTIARL